MRFLLYYMEAPRLIEPNARAFFQSKLESCHSNRVKIYMTALNISVLMFVLFLFGGYLYYCYKNKPTVQERNQQMIRDQQYVLSKIRYYQNEKAKHEQMMSDITTLPVVPTQNLGASFY